MKWKTGKLFTSMLTSYSLGMQVFWSKTLSHKLVVPIV
jgi:hypothetical protein